MFSTLSAVFLFGRAFVCFSAPLAVHYFGVYSVLGSFSKRKGDCIGYNGCVSVRYDSLFISLPLFTKVHKTTT